MFIESQKVWLLRGNEYRFYFIIWSRALFSPSQQDIIVGFLQSVENVISNQGKRTTILFQVHDIINFALFAGGSVKSNNHIGVIIQIFKDSSFVRLDQSLQKPAQFLYFITSF